MSLFLIDFQKNRVDRIFFCAPERLFCSKKLHVLFFHFMVDSQHRHKNHHPHILILGNRSPYILRWHTSNDLRLCRGNNYNCTHTTNNRMCQLHKPLLPHYSYNLSQCNSNKWCNSVGQIDIHNYNQNHYK